jgi:hypothetical protein
VRKDNFLIPGLALLVIVLLFSWANGCSQRTPSAATMEYHAPCPDTLLAGFETAPVTSVSGSVTTISYVPDAGVTLNDPSNGVTYTSILTRSPYYVTQGLYSLDVDILTPVSFNQNIMIMTFAKPLTLTNTVQVIMDVTVDPSVVNGAGYHTLLFVADDGASNKYFQAISGDFPTINAGSQSVVWNINFSAGTINPNEGMTKWTFVYNNNATGNSNGIPNGTGNIYMDNLRLVPNCP